MYPVEVFDHNGKTIVIHQDCDEWNNPRDWDNLGVMIHWHPDYLLGDMTLKDFDAELDYRRPRHEVVARYLRMVHGATVVLPLNLLDHSGLHMWAGGNSTHWSDPGGWDSGQVGWIFDTPETRKLIGTPLDLIEECLRDEVKTYDQYLTGDVYSYTIYDMHEYEQCSHCADPIDSCGGFFGYDYVMEEAKAMAA